MKGTAPSTTSDLEAVVQRVRERLPDVRWAQLSVSWPGDDDGLWFFWLPEQPGDVQIESSMGVCPFMVETDKHDDRISTLTPEDTADLIVKWLQLPGGRTMSPGYDR